MVSITILMSIATSVKDYIEIAHKLIESAGPIAPSNQTLTNSLVSNGLLSNSNNFFGISDYSEFGAILTYLVLSIKEFLANFISLKWLSNIWSLPLIVPDITLSMLSEISVLDSYFTNAFSFLEKGVSASLQTNVNTLGLATDNLISLEKINQNQALFGFEKFMVGLLNSCFLFLPSSTAHLITLRRFVMQGVEAGFIAGLGTIAGNFLWLASIILGLRFIVIPWLSLDIFRYVLGFMLLVKYLWDTSKDLNKTNQTRNNSLDNNTKNQIFLLNFLLALTEQTSIYPFISNMSFGAEGSILEGFHWLGNGSENFLPFLGIHLCYLLGILVGSFSLLQFAVWFWENPAFSIYMWVISSTSNSRGGGRVNTSTYYKVVNFVFLYLTMLCAISSIPYFGLDYTVTKPLGLIPQDKMIDQKLSTANGKSENILQEFSFLNTKPTDKNSRTKDGVHARRERWKERLIKYQAFDGSLYGQGVYDILTMEDLNYGFDRFWLRRKMRNHQIRFRLFPGPWMRSVKKQLNKPGSQGPRMEFFRILFEQYYHPSFGRKALIPKQTNANKPLVLSQIATQKETAGINFADHSNTIHKTKPNLNSESNTFKEKLKKQTLQKGLISQHSALRKFSSNLNVRINKSLSNYDPTTSFATKLSFYTPSLANHPGFSSGPGGKNLTNLNIYSKSLKHLFTKINKEYSFKNFTNFRNLSKNLLVPSVNLSNVKNSSFKKTFFRKKLDKKERALLLYKTNLLTMNPNMSFNVQNLEKSKGIFIDPNSTNPNQSLTNIVPAVQQGQLLLQPLNTYLQKNDLFKLKLQYYSTKITRKFSPGNNQPYFKTLLKRAFYYHKPSLRLKRTLFTAAMRRGFRKKSVLPKKLIYPYNTLENFTVKSTFAGPKNLMNEAGNTFVNAQTNILTKNDLIVQDLGQYSVLGKLSSRYRYQIYKDVLQHWYYSPFNRLLLKFDIDSFMARQPNPHFLTKKEERLLHLRRVLLYEHYNTLRWYTYMQHYLTMKSRIGGTKSFASTPYNQQFSGTFKKIRHLFYITPSQGQINLNNSSENKNLQANNGSLGAKDFAPPILKFDQPLYNKSNLTKNVLGSDYSSKINVGPYKHWNLEKYPPDITKDLKSMQQPQENLPKPNTAVLNNLIDTSLAISGSLVLAEKAISQKSPTWCLQVQDCANPSLENLEYLNSINQSKPINSLGDKRLAIPSNIVTEENFNSKILLLDLLKRSKTFLNNQSFLKNYISHRIEKRSEQQRNLSPQNTKEVKSIVLDSLKNWYSPIYSLNDTMSAKNSPQVNQKNDITTGVRKALNDGVFVLNNKNVSIQNKAFFTKENTSIKFTDKKAFNEINLRLSNLKQSLKTEEQLKQTLTSIASFKTKANKIQNLHQASLYKNEILNKTKVLQKIISTTLKPLVLLQRQFLQKRSEKTLEWWRQKQRVMSKLKASRKKSRYKNIKASITQKTTGTAKGNPMSFSSSKGLILQSYLLPFESLRKKEDSTWKTNPNESKPNLLKTIYQKYLARKFKKQMKGRRYRNLALTGSRGFAYVRKPKNINSFTTPADYLENLTPILGESIQSTYSSGSPLKNLHSKEEKTMFLQDFKKKLSHKIYRSLSNKNLTNLDSLESSKKSFTAENFKNFLIQGYVKKAPSKKRSKRTWKKRKRQKFTKNHYKYRKRQIHGLGKLVVLAKKAKKIKNNLKFQNWWWNSYLPATTKKFNKDSNQSITVNNISFKPLSTIKALDLINPLQTASLTQKPNVPTTVEKENSFTTNSVNSTSTLQNISFKPLFNSTTTIPFYAGWDESLRKFVVTNRLLSRTKAGNEIDLNKIFSSANVNPEKELNLSNNDHPKISSEYALEFSKAPIKGLNEGSFLYLQNEMSFNSYIIDQFIPNNQSFYAPLGWNNFRFKHSLLKNWLVNIKETQPLSSANLLNNAYNNIAKQKGNINQENPFYISQKPQASLYNKNLSYLKNIRIKKRYKLLKQTPMQLMYLPTGQLLTQTLPSHYISVFDKQYRFPRNIYIKRSLPNSKTLTNSQLAKGLNPKASNIKDLAILESSSYKNSLGGLEGPISQNSLALNPEFTLRKRVKPRRKYHKKRLYKKDFLIYPRRTKFQTLETTTTNADNFRLRPSTLLTPKTTQSKKSKNPIQSRTNAKTNPVRLRQLRRREFSQVFKPLQRFQPQYGGFTWPGDYLRLEVIPMPKLDSLQEVNSIGNLASQSLTNDQITTVKSNLTAPNRGLPTKAKLKINVQPVGLLPRKYFAQKHNLKVFKKKMYLKYYS